MKTATGTTSAWQAAFSRSIQDPEAFWAEAGAGIHWYKNWDQVLDKSRTPFYRWFTGGQLNTCYNALDRHVENGRASQTALIYDSPVTNQTKTFTYHELRDIVARFAGALAQQGVALFSGHSATLPANTPTLTLATECLVRSDARAQDAESPQ